MLVVNTDEFTIKWNEKLAMEISDNIWVYSGVERADDAWVSGLIGY